MPYADIAAFVFLLLSGGLALAHSDEWPSGNAWSKGHPLLLAQLLVFVLLGLTQLAILIAGRRGERDKGLEESCQLVAAYIDEHCPEVQLPTSVSTSGRWRDHLSRAISSARAAFCLLATVSVRGLPG